MEATAALQSRFRFPRAGEPARPAAIGVIALVLGYLAAWLGYVLTLHPAGIVFLWPPSGLALAALLLLPRRDWMAVVAGGLIGNVLTDVQHGAAIYLAIAGSAANAAEQVCAAFVVSRVARRRVRMTSLRDVAALVLGGVLVANSVTALLGGLVLTFYTTEHFWRAWFNWFVGDGMGMLIIAPAVIAGVDALRTPGRVAPRQIIEDLLFIAAVVIVTTLLIGEPGQEIGGIEGHAYLAIPLLILAGIRLGPWGATMASMTLTAAVAWFAIRGTLHFGPETDSSTTRLLGVYTYLALAAVSSLIPAAVLAEHEETSTELRASESRFRQIAENIQEAFFVVELPNWLPVYVSPSWGTIWGRPMSDGYDSRTWLDAVHEDDRATMRAAQAASVRGEVTETEFRILRLDGSTRVLRGRSFPIRNPTGAVVRVVGIAEDVTELRDSERKFNQAQKLEAVGRLAGGVAHDFNNLLTVIFAESEFLAASDLSPENSASVTEVQRAAESASALTRQLLAFSRRQIVEPRVFDLNTAVTDISRMLGRLIGEDIRLDLRLGGRPLGILADRGQVEQLITNLAVNGRDAMPRGGVLLITTDEVTHPGETDVEAKASTWTGEHPTLGWVALSVRDTGTGMSEEVMAHAFEPFFTTKDMGRGTGLGLATCHGIATQAGGRIGITSKVGVGTTIRVLFPRVPIVGEQDMAAPTAAAGGHERVLLVEDETGVRKATARLLRARGYDVVEARDGDDALRQLATERPVDLLLTDVVLPGMSGRELSERVRETRPGIKTLFASGYTDDVVLHKQMLSRDAAFLAKPFTSDALARRVREVLDDTTPAVSKPDDSVPGDSVPGDSGPGGSTAS